MSFTSMKKSCFASWKKQKNEQNTVTDSLTRKQLFLNTGERQRVKLIVCAPKCNSSLFPSSQSAMWNFFIKDLPTDKRWRITMFSCFHIYEYVAVNVSQNPDECACDAALKRVCSCLRCTISLHGNQFYSSCKMNKISSCRVLADVQLTVH